MENKKTPVRMKSKEMSPKNAFVYSQVLYCEHYTVLLIFSSIPIASNEVQG